MNYLISLTPVILYLMLIKAMDGFSLTKWQKLAECTAWGMVTCVICFFLGQLVGSGSSVRFPAIEEILKCTPLILAIHKNRSAFFSESLMYGAAIGGGFALLENFLYAFFNPGFTFWDAILRGFGTALVHMSCTALCATMALVGLRYTKMMKKPAQVLSAVAAALPAIIIHVLYNLFLLPVFVQLVLVVIVMVMLFVWIYDLDAKLIHKWLDLCINNDISLLKSIKEGGLQQTNAGQYLILVREKFPPEQFFDILVYLGLYLSLSIAAKSRMIMKEAGLDMPLSQKEHDDNAAKIQELLALRTQIGKSGVQILSPLINIKAVDEWAIKELL